MSRGKVRRVVFQPTTYRSMQRGINQMVEAVRPTLGPLPRAVAIERADRGKMPELLDSGGVIVRRILELPDRDADMGAMFLRQVLWRVHEQVGDGTATTAVLFQSIYDQGVRYIVSGGNAMLLRGSLEQGLRVILDELAGMALPVEGEERLAEVAESICYDRPLAEMLGEIFDIIGEYGQCEVRSGRSRELEREYIEGMYWGGGLFSREMIADRSRLRTEMQNASVLIGDLTLEDPRQVVPVLEMAGQAGLRNLLILASKLSDGVTALLLSVSQEPEKFHAIAAKTPGATSTDQATAVEDLAVLTGGRPLVKAAGDTLGGDRLEDLGRARRAWADRNYFGIVGGKGDPRALRAHIANLRSAFSRATEAEARRKLQQRIGKLMGGSATLWVGGATETEIGARKELAKRTADALRGAVREGVVPGGGVSLLACRPALQQRLDQSTSPDERAAYRILIKAVEAPIRTILANAGYDASEVMAEIRLADRGHGFDVRSGRIVDMAQAGIWDAAAVLRAAVHGAVASAALALTTEVLIHHKEPKQEMQP
ncbi:MAG: chaperonin GroEL [Anaerolineae bacterium]|nr:MAG: chaperonin GroEL [Anaerolineae bacterium]